MRRVMVWVVLALLACWCAVNAETLGTQDTITFLEISHKVWQRMGALNDQVETLRDRIKQITKDQETDGDADESLLQLTIEEIHRISIAPQPQTAHGASFANIPDQSAPYHSINDLSQAHLREAALNIADVEALANIPTPILLQLAASVTPDDDDTTENKDECILRNSKVVDQAAQSGDYTQDQIDKMTEKYKIDCERKVDQSLLAGRLRAMQEIWYNIRADSLRYKERLEKLLNEYRDFNEKFSEKKNYE